MFRGITPQIVSNAFLESDSLEGEMTFWHDEKGARGKKGWELGIGNHVRCMSFMFPRRIDES